jgi:hypothetical protein
MQQQQQIAHTSTQQAAGSTAYTRAHNAYKGRKPTQTPTTDTTTNYNNQ